MVLTNGLLLGTLSKVVLPGNWTLGADGRLVHPEVDEGIAMSTENPQTAGIAFRFANSV